MSQKVIAEINNILAEATKIQGAVPMVNPAFTGFTALENACKKFNKTADWVAGREKALEEYLKDKQAYRKILSPFIDGSETKRLNALRERTCVSIHGRNEQIDEAAFHLYSATLNASSTARDIKHANAENRKLATEIRNSFKLFKQKIKCVKIAID